MKKVLILFVSLFCAFINSKGVRNLSRRSSITAHPHDHSKVKNFAALEIFSPKKTGKDCIKCLPDNFCECECNCKNKTGFQMKYRHASLGSASKREIRKINNGRKSKKVAKKSPPIRKCLDLPLEGSEPEIEGGEPEIEGGEPEIEGGEPEIEGGEPEIEGGEPEIEGGEPEIEGGEPEVEIPENGATECYSSCVSSSGIQTEECSCSCSC